MFLRDAIRILKLTEPPFAGRVRFLAEANRTVFETLRFGILFVMAFWNGTSSHSFTWLKRCLLKNDPEGLLEVLVVDTDGCPDLYEVPELLGKMHGNGEVVWILEGRILGTASFGSHPDEFDTLTKQLLARRSASVGQAQISS